MSRPTSYLVNPQVPRTRTDRYTIIARRYIGIRDGNISRGLDMDAIGVRAQVRRSNTKITHAYIVAAIDHHVSKLAIDGG